MAELDEKLIIPAGKAVVMLGISLRTLNKWCDDPQVGFPKTIVISGRKYFRANEIAEWIDRRATHNEKLRYHGRPEGKPRLMPALDVE